VEVLDIEETPGYSNILTEQLSSPENEEEGEHENEEEEAEEIRDTIHVQVPPNQGRTQQKNTTALMTLEATPDHLIDDTGWGRGYALAPEGEEPDKTSNRHCTRRYIISAETISWPVDTPSLESVSIRRPRRRQ
jgi:hypothetical protein